MKVFSDPCYIHLTKSEFVVGIEFPTESMPVFGEMVEIKMFGGSAYSFVKGADYGSDDETSHILFIAGNKIVTGVTSGG